MENKDYVSLRRLQRYSELSKADAQAKYDTLDTAKKDKDLIVTYQEGSSFYATYSSEEIAEAINNGQTVKFRKDSELLNILESTNSYATFYMFYINMSGKLQQKIVVISGNSIALEQDDTYDYATSAQLNNKVNKTELNNYYTKSEIDTLELIAVNEIDTICGDTIQSQTNTRTIGDVDM